MLRRSGNEGERNGAANRVRATLVPPFRNMRTQCTRDTRVSFTRARERNVYARVKVELARDDAQQVLQGVVSARSSP